MRAADGYFANGISVTTEAFKLIGGLYGVDALATWGGSSVKLQRVAGDGSTVLPVAASTDFSANGFATVNLPAGDYKLTIATATAVYVTVQRIPGE